MLLFISEPEIISWARYPISEGSSQLAFIKSFVSAKFRCDRDFSSESLSFVGCHLAFQQSARQREILVIISWPLFHASITEKERQNFCSRPLCLESPTSVFFSNNFIKLLIQCDILSEHTQKANEKVNYFLRLHKTC